MFLKPHQQKPYIFKQTEIFEVKDVYFWAFMKLKALSVNNLKN